MDASCTVDDGTVTPRDWLDNPDTFGKSDKAVWRRVTDDDPGVQAAFAAAYLQHVFACQVAEALRDEGRNAVWLAERAGLKQRHLSHVLRGRQSVSFPTMIAVVRALDRVELLPAPSSLSDLIP